MATISRDKLKLVKKLYFKDLYSAREIGAILRVSIDAVYYFMRHHRIQRRNFSEHNKVTFTKKLPSFNLKNNLSQREKELKIIGTMLYWGEGYKAKSSMGIDFANSDPGMVYIFVLFLRCVCGINEFRLRAFIYCYANQNVGQLTDFWSNVTGISKKQFTKPYIRYDFQKNKKHKMPYGLIHIRYSDKKLLFMLQKWIKEYKNKFCVGTQVVNEDAL